MLWCLFINQRTSRTLKVKYYKNKILSLHLIRHFPHKNPVHIRLRQSEIDNCNVIKTDIVHNWFQFNIWNRIKVLDKNVKSITITYIFM